MGFGARKIMAKTKVVGAPLPILGAAGKAVNLER